MTYNLAAQNVISSSIDITWTLDGNAEYQVPFQT